MSLVIDSSSIVLVLKLIIFELTCAFAALAVVFLVWLVVFMLELVVLLEASCPLHPEKDSISKIVKDGVTKNFFL